MTIFDLTLFALFLAGLLHFVSKALFSNYFEAKSDYLKRIFSMTKSIEDEK